MKTQRRHELATNVLADWLGAQIEALRPYSTAIWATVLAVLVATAAYLYFSRQHTGVEQRSWDEYLQGLDTALRGGEPDTLRDVADEYSSTDAGLWARLSLGDAQSSRGIDEMFNDRALANQLLDEAVESYRQVLEEAPADSVLAQYATFGLAQTYESQNKLDDARKHYEEIRTKWPDGVLTARAEQRLKDLDRRGTKEFYDWFAKRRPKPPKPTEPGVPGEKPPFDLGSLNDDSDIDLDGSEKKSPASPKKNGKK